LYWWKRKSNVQMPSKRHGLNAKSYNSPRKWLKNHNLTKSIYDWSLG
jgi:hypothetical protein